MNTLGDILSLVGSELVETLRDSAERDGFSVRLMPEDLKFKVQRTASAFVMLTSARDDAKENDGLATTSTVSIDCSILYAGFELQSPKGIFALSATVERVLSTWSCSLPSRVAQVTSLAYTSKQNDGLWQYSQQVRINVYRTTRNYNELQA